MKTDDEVLPIGYTINIFLIFAFSPFILLAILVFWGWDALWIKKTEEIGN